MEWYWLDTWPFFSVNLSKVNITEEISIQCLNALRISITVNSLFISSPFKGGSYLRGGLINLEKTLVSILHEELKDRVEKLKNKKVGDHAVEDQNQI